MQLGYDFENGNTRIYYRVQNGDTLDQNLFRRIQSPPENANFVPVQIVQGPQGYEMSFNIRGLINLLAWKDSASKRDLKKLDKNMKALQLYLNQSMIPREKLLLEERYMYVDTITGKIRMMCLPVNFGGAYYQGYQNGGQTGYQNGGQTGYQNDYQTENQSVHEEEGTMSFRRPESKAESAAVEESPNVMGTEEEGTICFRRPETNVVPVMTKETAETEEPAKVVEETAEEPVEEIAENPAAVMEEVAAESVEATEAVEEMAENPTEAVGETVEEIAEVVEELPAPIVEAVEEAPVRTSEIAEVIPAEIAAAIEEKIQLETEEVELPGDVTELMEFEATITAKLTRIKTGEVYEINRVYTSFGRRDADVSFCIRNNPTISKVHCAICFNEKGYTIIDRGSRNGTYVDGARLPENVPVKLNNYTRIQMAGEKFLFEID